MATEVRAGTAETIGTAETAEATEAAPAEAAEGTIRRLYAASGSRNAVHASDSPENAAREISIFFNAAEIYD